MTICFYFEIFVQISGTMWTKILELFYQTNVEHTQHTINEFVLFVVLFLFLLYSYCCVYFWFDRNIKTQNPLDIYLFLNKNSVKLLIKSELQNKSSGTVIPGCTVSKQIIFINVVHLLALLVIIYNTYKLTGTGACMFDARSSCDKVRSLCIVCICV